MNKIKNKNTMIPFSAIRVESLKDYIGVLSDDELMDLGNKIYMTIDFVKADYPNHTKWYFTKQLPETLHSDRRNILFVKDKGEIIGVVNLLNNDEEKKICSLYVKEEYRGQGIGSMLVEEAIKWLGTRYPIISLVEGRYGIYKPLLEKYNWKLTRVIDGYYKEGVVELFFNVPENNTIYR